MGRYALRGTMYGRQVEIEWNDGQLTGDRLLVDFVTADAQLLEGRPVGPPTGPFTYSQHLADPLSVLFLIRAHLDETLEATGEIPAAPGSGDRIY